MQDAVYLEQIRQLVELQKIDDEIFGVRQDLEQAPLELEELQQRYDIVEQRRSRVQDKLDHLEEQKKRLSFEIDEDSARIKKSKNKLMQVENTREYQAMLREMDNIEKANRTREEDRMTLLEELALQKDELAAVEAEQKTLGQELEGRKGGLESRLRVARETLDVLDRKRDQAARQIPQPVFMRYEFIRKRLEHPVIVAVSEGVCSGCHIAVPPQSFIELQRGQQILSCPNCQRLIFWSEHFESPKSVLAEQEEPAGQ